MVIHNHAVGGAVYEPVQQVVVLTSPSYPVQVDTRPRICLQAERRAPSYGEGNIFFLFFFLRGP